MSIAPLPNNPKRIRAQVWDPSKQKMVSVPNVLGLPPGQRTWPNTRKGREQAILARAQARKLLQGGAEAITVRMFRDRWLNDPLYARPKQSTMIHNTERTKAFAERYGDLPLAKVTDILVAQWLAGGGRASTVPALRAMFNDAMSAKAGRLIDVNPFANLRLARTKGNRHKQPPSQEAMSELVRIAWDITPPTFAAYFEFGCLSAIRPSELDALTPGDVDREAGEVHVRRQWNVKTATFTEPKYGGYVASLVGRAEECLDRLDLYRDHGADRWLFTTTRGTHYSPSSRNHHWNRVRCAAGLPEMTLYLATRHYFGWYAINVLSLPPHVVAVQLGHRDGGRLVTTLYGHPSAKLARQQIRNAHDNAGRIVPLRRKEAV